MDQDLVCMLKDARHGAWVSLLGGCVMALAFAVFWLTGAVATRIAPGIMAHCCSSGVGGAMMNRDYVGFGFVVWLSIAGLFVFFFMVGAIHSAHAYGDGRKVPITK